MNRANQSNSLPGESEDLVYQACRHFESAWHQDENYRVEQTLDRVNSLIRSNGAIDSHELYNKILTELIHVEMSLRLDAEDGFQPSEYLKRFPDLEDQINSAWSALQNKHPDSTIFNPGFCSAIQVIAPANPSEPSLEVDLTGKQILPVSLGPYEKIEPLGAGGFGVVCKAIDTRSGRNVAMKFPHRDKISSDFTLRLLVNEARRAESLVHPNIVSVYGVEFIDGYVVLVQQYVAGETLKESLNKGRSQIQIVSLVQSLAQAIAYSHRIGIIHRDLKPANILMDQDDFPLIADFGLALHRDEQKFAISEPCGTPSYMSPEQVSEPSQNLDGRTDIWSLGVIIYELLTGKKPFQGATQGAVYSKISTGIFKPPRELNPSVDEELQRICMKCLENQLSTRYLTADELASDLSTWSQKYQSSGQQEQVKILPRGFASFVGSDAPFFIRLLPGTQDREGLPYSLRFWIDRIDNRIKESTVVPVGVIYGPSGSGKSSFVKAGLIPRVEHLTESIYVESTADDTEIRLIKALKTTFPGIPEGIALPNILEGLQQGNWRTSAKKVLVILDQFEQWLSKEGSFAKTQLTMALKQCDGKQLQCILLVRDEFWLKTSRYFDALEYNLIEGHNSQLVDLFDFDHAHKVLKYLGQAFGKLPADDSKLTPDQKSFLKNSVEQLAVNDYVICIHLTVFAEIFRHRSWSIKELQTAGGVSGVGLKYLDSTFGSEAKTARNRNWKKNVEAVLNELLPDGDSSIRGAMKSRTQLRIAADMEGQEFKELLNYLENELKLITRVDPDISGTPDLNSGDENSQFHFQLTHDYLVPSIRQWLGAELSKTVSGRAKLRLKELGSLAVPGETPRYLPTHLEWLTWQFLFSRQNMDRQQAAVMRTAKHHFWTSFLKYGAIAFVMITVLTMVFLNYQNDRTANQLLNNLFGQEIGRVPAIVQQLIQYRDRIEPHLLQLQNDDNTPSEKRRRVNLALLPFKPELKAKIIDAMISGTSPDELEAHANILAQQSKPNIAKLHANLDDNSAWQASQFRSLVALAKFADTTDPNLNSFAALASSQLPREPITEQPKWILLLDPLRDKLTTTFKEVLSSTADESVANSMSLALYQYLDETDRMGYFVNVLSAANNAQFNAICRIIEENSRDVDGKKSIADYLALKPDLSSKERANLAVASFRLGDSKELFKIFSNKNDLATRSYAITRADSSRVLFWDLRRAYEDIDKFSDEKELIVQGLMLSMSLHLPVLYDQEHLSWLDAVIKDQCINSPFASCFAAAEYLCRKKGNRDYIKYRKARRKKHEWHGNVWINSLIHPFSIIWANQNNLLPQSIAVSMYETTNDMVAAPRPAAQNLQDFPFEVTDLLDVLIYLHRLNEGENPRFTNAFSGFNDAMDLKTLKMDRNINGYRMMDSVDWNAILVEGGGVQAFGENNELARYFVTSLANSTDAGGERTHVGKNFPNLLGLFDTLGNAHELVLREVNDECELYIVGCDSRQIASCYYDEINAKDKIISIKYIKSFDSAFRPIRSLKRSEPKKF